MKLVGLSRAFRTGHISKPRWQFDLGCVFVLVFLIPGLNLREREQTVVNTMREREKEEEGRMGTAVTLSTLISVMADSPSVLSPVCPPESSIG